MRPNRVINPPRVAQIILKLVMARVGIFFLFLDMCPF